MRISKLTFQNIGSYGNTPTVIEFDINDKLIGIIGENGHGKCVGPGTELEIEFENDELYQLFLIDKNETNPSPATKKIKCNIQQLHDFLKHKNINLKNHTINVSTKFGMKRIDACEITAKNSDNITISTSKGKNITTSPDHRLFINNKWNHVKHIKIGDVIETVDGDEKIKDIKINNNKKDLYDLQVREVHEFWANQVRSHNSFISDVIMYGFYGVPFRKIKKQSLVNRINEKGLYVKIEFESKGQEWIIERTIKDVQITKKGDVKPMDLEAHMLDIQKYIVTNILGIDENIFRTVSMVSMRNFKSFFSLPKDKRRELFETIIDISVLRNMKKLFQSKLNELERTQSNLNRDIINFNNNIKESTDNLAKLILMESTSIEELNKNYIQIDSQLKQKEKELNEFPFTINDLEENNNECIKQLNEIKTDVKMLSKDVVSLREEEEFFKNNDKCPRCRKALTRSEKKKEIEELEKSLNKIEESIKSKNEEELELKEIYENINAHMNRWKDISKSISELENNLALAQTHIDNVKQLQLNNTLKMDLNNQIKSYKEKLVAIEEEYNNIAEFISIIEIFKNILSDDGLKKFIYNKFMPILNNYINKILKEFEFNVRFELMESLDEKIYNKLGEEIDINTFSNGEQQLIDISFMFGLQQFLQKINNFNNKMCFIDELFDASLDVINLEKIINFMRSSERNKQIIIITHKTNIKEYFDCCFHVKKENEFSKVYKE